MLQILSCLSFICIHSSQTINNNYAIFCALFCRSNYFNIVKYNHNISIYIMCMNGYAFGNFNSKKFLCIRGHACTYGNIVGFINSYRCSLFSTNCSFEQHSNYKLFMKRKTLRFVILHAITNVIHVLITHSINQVLIMYLYV